jgi:hypothetical protein
MAKGIDVTKARRSLVRRAQKVLGAKSRTQTIEMSLEAVVETSSSASSSKDTALKRGPVTLTTANLAIPDTSVYVDSPTSGRFNRKSSILNSLFVRRSHRPHCATHRRLPPSPISMISPLFVKSWISTLFADSSQSSGYRVLPGRWVRSL